jgi:hypothetical protein
MPVRDSQLTVPDRMHGSCTACECGLFTATTAPVSGLFLKRVN